MRFAEMGNGLPFLAMMEITLMGMDARLIVESNQDITAMEAHQIALITAPNSFLLKSSST